MGNELNAIRISDTIEKVHIDFSSIDSLYESSGFKRLYTIHTAETNKMTAKLGFHVGGFCDDRGSGGPDLAAEISGYDYLPSDLILCLMDSKYNFLPLNEKQLESLYSYLTTGDEAKEEMVEDTIEESIDEDVDDEDTLVDYVLFFKVDAKWPKSKDDFKTHYEFCYPLYLEKKPLFPYFSTLFEVEGIDRIHNTVSLVINRGKGEEHIQIKVGEEYAFDFAYQAQPNKRTYREGHAVLSLKHFNFGDDSVSGKLAVQNSFVTDNEASVDQTLYLENITVDSEEEITADLDSGDSYGIFMIDEASKFILCYGLRFNADDEAEEFFVPVWFDKPNEEYISYNEKRHFNEMINRITYKK